MRILLGMSGGLDSTYAAHRLMEEGHTVEGAILIMHGYTDLNAARQSAHELKIKLHEVDASALFESVVTVDFCKRYLRGETPNPCILCNREVKFKVLWEYAAANGFDKIATGHYAGVQSSVSDGETLYSIIKGKDPKKDQSYMLYRLPQEVLKNLILPLSDITKEQVRALSGIRGLSAAEKEESQEICFIQGTNYADYIEDRFGKSKTGCFVDENGKILGEHKGIVHYTVGQRKGLGIALGSRAFITDINPENGDITLSVTPKTSYEFCVEDVIYSGIKPLLPGQSAEYMVKVRYLAPPIFATVYCEQDGRLRVRIPDGAKSVTAGQSAVFYCNDRVVFGGFICKSDAR